MCTVSTYIEQQILEKGIKQIIPIPTSDLQSKSETQYLILYSCRKVYFVNLSTVDLGFALMVC